MQSLSDFNFFSGTEIKPIHCPKHGMQKGIFFDNDGLCSACEDERKKKNIADILQKEKSDYGKNCGIAKRFENDEYKDFETPNAELVMLKKAIFDYGKSLDPKNITDRGLVITGDVGRGKTMLASILTKHAIHRGLTAKYITLPDFLEEIYATFDDKSKSVKEIMEYYTDFDLLVLDEAGVNKGTKSEKDRIFQLINSRYNRCLPTVVMSNCDFSDLHEYVGSRVTSRLRQDCSIIGINSFDWRAQS